MQEILELFVIGVFLTIIAFLIFVIFWWLTVTPYTNYQLNKKTNKIQWRCEETYDSRNNFRNGETDNHICNLSYRVIPSEVNKFIRIYGDNPWCKTFTHLKFKNEKEFKNFVKDFQTINDIKRYLNKEDGILWYEP